MVLQNVIKQGRNVHDVLTLSCSMVFYFHCYEHGATVGELITYHEATSIEHMCSKDVDVGCYMYKNTK